MNIYTNPFIHLLLGNDGPREGGAEEVAALVLRVGLLFV